MSQELFKCFILNVIEVVNIPLFAVFHITGRNGYDLRFPGSGYHIDLSRLYSAPKGKSGHTGYQTAKYHISTRAAR